MNEELQKQPKAPNLPVKKWVKIAFITIWSLFVASCVAAFAGAVINC